MEDANTVDAKELDLVDNATKVQVEDNPSVEDPQHSDLVKENPMPSQQQEVLFFTSSSLLAMRIL